VAGVTIRPFRDGVLNGFLCSFMPPYLLGYVIKEWEMMKGPFLSYLASFGVVIVMATALPGLAALRPGVPVAARKVPPPAQPGPVSPFEVPTDLPGMPKQLPVRGFPPPRMPGPPPGVQPPAMTNAITLVVIGLKTEAQKKDIGEKLVALLARVSGGYQLSASDIGGRPQYQITTVNALDVREFVGRIDGVRVTGVSGQTVELVVPPS
jgi:hypothetical protein